MHHHISPYALKCIAIHMIMTHSIIIIIITSNWQWWHVITLINWLRQSNGINAQSIYKVDGIFNLIFKFRTELSAPCLMLTNTQLPMFISSIRSLMALTSDGISWNFHRVLMTSHTVRLHTLETIHSLLRSIQTKIRMQKSQNPATGSHFVNTAGTMCVWIHNRWQAKRTHPVNFSVYFAWKHSGMYCRVYSHHEFGESIVKLLYKASPGPELLSVRRATPCVTKRLIQNLGSWTSGTCWVTLMWNVGLYFSSKCLTKLTNHECMYQNIDGTLLQTLGWSLDGVYGVWALENGLGIFFFFWQLGIQSRWQRLSAALHDSNHTSFKMQLRKSLELIVHYQERLVEWIFCISGRLQRTQEFGSCCFVWNFGAREFWHWRWDCISWPRSYFLTNWWTNLSRKSPFTYVHPKYEPKMLHFERLQQNWTHFDVWTHTMSLHGCAHHMFLQITQIMDFKLSKVTGNVRAHSLKVSGQRFLHLNRYNELWSLFNVCTLLWRNGANTLCFCGHQFIWFAFWNNVRFHSVHSVPHCHFCKFTDFFFVLCQNLGHSDTPSSFCIMMVTWVVHWIFEIIQHTKCLWNLLCCSPNANDCI